MAINYALLDDSLWITKRYIGDKMSTIAIAKLCDCSPALVSKRLKLYGIKTRSISESMRLISHDLSEANRKNWAKKEYRSKTTTSIRKTYSTNQRLREETAKAAKDYWELKTSKREASKRSKRNWSNKEYKNKLISSIKTSWTPEKRQKCSKQSKKLWCDEKYKATQKLALVSYYKSQIARELISYNSQKLWQNPEYRAKHVEISTKLWQNPEYRAKQSVSMSKIAKQSILDTTVIAILKNLGYDAAPASVGPWTFDAVVKLEGRKDLLIECQGDYWHSRKERIIRDTQKRSYFENHLTSKYDLLILWEHEFYSLGRISEILRNATIEEDIIINYDLKDITIKQVDSKLALEFLQKYHYMMKSKGGIHYGAFLNDELISVCSFSYVTRKESATRLGLKHTQVLELSRLCVNPVYRKKNLLSKLISKSIKKLRKSKSDLKAILTFADTTLGHTGTVYKASNFAFDGEAKPTYWYIDTDGYYRHKKTVWDQAKRLGMKENEYANYCKLKKIKGTKLLRFIYKIS